MKPELHLPDLPEVAVALGRDGAAATVPPPDRIWPRAPWHLRLLALLSAYLPILLMTLLAAATWWLVENSPKPIVDVKKGPLRHEPDYEMSGFIAQRFDARGQLVLRVEGDQMRHFPDTDEIEVDTVRLQSYAPDGRQTRATARRGLANGDATEFRLLGGAEVVSEVPQQETMTMRGEFLQVSTKPNRVFSDQPVVVQQGRSTLRGQGLDYNHATGVARLTGRVQATMEPALAKAGAAKPAAEPPATPPAKPATKP
jgi:lipopolysaccharide export system protein LptC